MIFFSYLLAYHTCVLKKYILVIFVSWNIFLVFNSARKWFIIFYHFNSNNWKYWDSYIYKQRWHQVKFIDWLVDQMIVVKVCSLRLATLCFCRMSRTGSMSTIGSSIIAEKNSSRAFAHQFKIKSYASAFWILKLIFYILI